MANRSFKDFVEKVGRKRPGVRAEMEIQRSLRTALVHARKREGLSQRALADKADWKQPYVARLEGAAYDIRQFRLSTIEQYLGACNVKVGLVLYREEPQGISIVEATPIEPCSDMVAQCFSTFKMQCTPPAAPAKQRKLAGR